ncbi:MAG: MFS transporter [Eubacteriaceae bacterium]|nr:MFS transporter [Eubacteriaceae bacterium]
MENQKSNSVKWILLILLTAAFMGSFAARMLWSPFISLASADLGIDATQAGLFMSMFYIGYMITQLPGGILADRYGVKYVLSISVFVTGLFTLLLSQVHTLQIGLLFRVIAGLGSGTIVACASRVVAGSFKPEQRGTAMGIFFAATTMGIFFSNLIAPIALQVGTWRTSFIWMGTGIIVVSVLIFILIKKEPRKDTNEKMFSGLLAVVKSRNVLIMAFVGFTYIWLVLAVATWANRYMASIGIDPSAASGVMRWYGLAGIAASLLSGWVVDTFKLNRLYFMIATYASMIAMTFIFSAQTSSMGLAIAGAVYGFVSYLPTAHLSTLVIEYAGVQNAGTAVGGANFCWQLGAVISPALAGSIFESTGSFSTVWILLAAAPAVGILSLFVLKAINIKKVSEAEIVNN